MDHDAITELAKKCAAERRERIANRSEGEKTLVAAKRLKRDRKRVNSFKSKIGQFVKPIINDPFSFTKHEGELYNLVLAKSSNGKVPPLSAGKVYNCHLLSVSDREFDFMLQSLGIYMCPTKDMREYKHLLQTKLTHGLYAKYRDLVVRRLADSTSSYEV